jgi:hypothetical protein
MRSRGNLGSPPATVTPPVIVIDLLGWGAHANPSRGCNVLEYASVLAGERWSSRPQSVHPALADVADMVNDQMTDARRRLLTPLAPWLPGTNTADPATWPAITEVCVRAALAWASPPDGARLLADLDATRDWRAETSRPAGGRRRAPWAGRRERRWAQHAICSALLTVAASADQDAADARLCQVLLDCLTECRRLAGKPAVDPRLPLEDCPQRLAVEPHLMWSPGCDWVELGYRPVRALLPELPPAAHPQPTRGKTESKTERLFWLARGVDERWAKWRGSATNTTSPDSSSPEHGQR